MSVAEFQRILSPLGIEAGRRFVLHVGGNQWYKNRAGVVRTFSLLKKRSEFDDVWLVMAGKPWTEELRALISGLNLTSSVLELTNPPNETLRALYSRAELLFFPSLQEGFGWPIIEAHACGCPVVTTNAPPMTQVGGDAAIYVDPGNEQTACDVIASSIGARLALAERSIRNAGRFRPEAMIDKYIAGYSRILAGDRLIVPASAMGRTLCAASASTGIDERN